MLNVDTQTYVAPRVESREQDGRVQRTAECGHEVWVSEHGLKRIAAGLHLVCGICWHERAPEGSTMLIQAEDGLWLGSR